MLNSIENMKDHRKTNTAQFHIFEITKIVKFIESKTGMVVARGWGRGKWGAAISGHKVSVKQDEALETIVQHCTIVNYNVHLKIQEDRSHV